MYTSTSVCTQVRLFVYNFGHINTSTGVSICTQVRVYIHKYRCTQLCYMYTITCACTKVRLHAHKYQRMYTSSGVSICTQVTVCQYVRLCPYVHKYGYVHMCTGMGVLYTLVYLSTGDIWPNSDSLPQPVTQPVRPIRELPLEGRQIGIMFG